MLHSIVWYTHFAFTLLLTIPKYKKMKKQKDKLTPDEFTEKSYEIVQKWAAKQLKWTGAELNLVGLSNIPSSAVVFISNHQSYFDIGLFLGAIEKPKGFISKIEMEKAPVIGKWMKFINCVFMDRSDIKKAAKAINAGIELIRNGNSLVIFPEGTRSKKNEMLDWKAGSFKLATKSKAPIVPITLYDSFTIIEGNNYRVKKNKVTMIIHPAIQTTDLTNEEISALPQRVKEIIQSGIDECEKNKKRVTKD